MSETFYGGFYGFDSAPFHITPDPTLIFPTETHRAALGAIEYGISAGKGFIAISGEVGVGKTTVLRVCLDALDPSKTKIIYLFSPALTTAELYSTILDEFDVMLPPTSNSADTLRMLQRTLLAVHESGVQVILAVDEAQNMPEATLESLRILSNLETHKSKLLQIILVGQPELETVLARHSLRQLAQRMAVRARIEALSFRQSCQYIRYRTHCAGRARSGSLFTTPALWYLAFVSRGIPRTINICCDNALINGYGHAAERISLRIARESCKAMKYRSTLRRSLAVAALAMMLIGIVVSGDAVLRRFFSAHAASNPAVLSTETPAGTLHAAAALPPTHAIPAVPTSNATPRETSPAPKATSPQEDAASTPPGAGTPDSSAAVSGGTQPPAHAAEPQATRPDPDATEQIPPSLRANPASAGSASPLPWISAAGEPSTKRTLTHAKSQLKWVVHDGDTLYKACRSTYGSCDGDKIRAIFARNPKIGPDATLREGDVIFMPDQAQQ